MCPIQHVSLWQVVLFQRLSIHCRQWPGAANASCSDSCNDFGTATASNGIPPYQYLWTPGNFTTSVVTWLCSGQYLIQVSDAGGSTVTDTVTCNCAPPTGSNGFIRYKWHLLGRYGDYLSTRWFQFLLLESGKQHPALMPWNQVIFMYQ